MAAGGTPNLEQRLSDAELLNFNNERRIQELQRMLAKAKDEKSMYKQRCAMQDKELLDLNNALKALQAQKDAFDNLSDKLAEVKQTAATSTTTNTDELDKRNKLIRELEDDVDSLNALSRELDALKKAYAQLKAEKMGLERELEIFGPDARPHRRYDWIECPINFVREGCKVEGFLQKAGTSRRGAWKKRYFILNEDCLFFYHSDGKDEKRCKYVRLQGCQVSVHKEASAAHHQDGFKLLKNPFPFRLDTPILDDAGAKITIVFNAVDEKERTTWVVSLREMIDKAENPPSSAASPPASPRGGPASARSRSKSLVSHLAMKAASDPSVK